jgi:protocatechuate 3,4-dioxygenase beta subunit
VPGRVGLRLAGAVAVASMLGSCAVGGSDSADEGAQAPATEEATGAVPTDAENSTTPRSSCSDSAAVTATEEATVTFGPINGVEATTAVGEPLVVMGTVYGPACEPVPGASLRMWQTDGNGDYGPGHGTENMQCCYLGGDVVTDADGHFQLITVRPAHYRGQSNPPPAHIHVEVRHPDAPPLETEIVFDDDEVLPANAAKLGLVVTSPTRAGDGWRAVAEIVLGGSDGRA